MGLKITSQIFEVMGARAGASEYRFDRYWRNIRTYTLHDPVIYSLYLSHNFTHPIALLTGSDFNLTA